MVEYDTLSPHPERKEANMADLDITKTESTQETTQDTTQESSTSEQTTAQTTDVNTQLQASIELLKEMQQTNANLMKEIENLKVANAKLALTQSVQAPQESAEELLNKMFS